MKFFLFIILLTFNAATHVLAGRALVTMYSHGYETAGGALLSKYPTWIKGRRVYPVAVHTSLVKKYKYKVGRLTVGKRSVFVHVVDECDKSTSSCRVNQAKAKRTGSLLVDVHAKAWKALGLKYSKGVYKAKISLGSIMGRNNKFVRGLLSSDARRGWVKPNWK